MVDVARWCRIRVVGPDGSELARYALEGSESPDMSAVDQVARVALSARRLGGGIELSEVSAALRELLELCGLRDVQGQSEGWKEPLWVKWG